MKKNCFGFIQARPQPRQTGAKQQEYVLDAKQPAPTLGLLSLDHCSI